MSTPRKRPRRPVRALPPLRLRTDGLAVPSAADLRREVERRVPLGDKNRDELIAWLVVIERLEASHLDSRRLVVAILDAYPDGPPACG